MNAKHRSAIAVIIALAFATAGVAQMGPRMGPPNIRGKWAPVVGQGATYSVDAKGKVSDFSVAVVGSEPVEGKTGYWMEIVSKEGSSEFVIKSLSVVTGKQIRRTRLIMQGPGQPPMEITAEMMQMMPGMGRMMQQNIDADSTDGSTLVGPETITVPAGEFKTEHRKTKDGADVWISEKAGPFQMVKYVGPDATMILTKVSTDAVTRIKGTPQRMEIPRM